MIWQFLTNKGSLPFSIFGESITTSSFSINFCFIKSFRTTIHSQHKRKGEVDLNLQLQFHRQETIKLLVV
jgi:hypothetical protein